MTRSWIQDYFESLVPRPGKFAAQDVVARSTLDPRRVRAVAHVQKLAELSGQNSRVVSFDQLEDLHLLRNDCEKGARLWIVEATFDQVEDAYPGIARDLGGDVVGIHPPNLLRWMVASRSEAIEVLDGIDTVRIPQDIVVALEDKKVDTRRASALSRLLKNPQTLVYLVVFVYSSLRALPVVFVKEFHGSVILLWSIDVITAVPYTWGVLAMVLAAKRWVRVAGALTTVITFMAPYIYFWMHGSSYPWYVTVIVGFLISTGVGIEIAKYVQEKSLEKKYSSVIVGAAPQSSPKSHA